MRLATSSPGPNQMTNATRATNAAYHARKRHQSDCRRKGKTGRNRVHRNTVDVDSPEAIALRTLGDGTLEGSQLETLALIRTVEEARRTSAKTTRYSQGVITRVGEDVIKTLFDPRFYFDHFTGTNDLSTRQIAMNAVVSERHWIRLKPALQELGVISFRHRSIATGLPDEDGVEQHIQISDIYWFNPANLVPWLREIYDRVKAEIKAAWVRRHLKRGQVPPRTPLVARDRPPRRVPALLNPIGWARAQAASIAAVLNPVKSYAEREAEAIAFATREALKGVPG